MSSYALAYTSEPAVTVGRSITPSTANAGDSVTVTITVNVGAIGSDPIRGFCIADRLPAGVTAGAGAVTVNGTPVTVVRETNALISSVPGTTTERWVLETPGLWTESNPVYASSTIVLTYDAVVDADTQTGDIVFPGCSWVGMVASLGDAGDMFGYEETAMTVPVIDSSPPTVVSVNAPGGDTHVTVTFSEDVTATTAGDAMNYTMDNGVTTSSVVIDNPHTVTLITSPLATGITYTLIVDGVEDVAGNPMAGPDTLTFTHTPSLVLHWSLDDMPGGTVEDASTNGHDGTVNGAVAAAGAVNGCLVFDGTDDYVTCALPTWDAPQYTVCAWAKAATVGQAQFRSIFNNSNTAVDSTMQIDVDGGTPGTYRAHFKTVMVTIGTVTTSWQHVAVTYDGTSVRTYLDGVLVIQQTVVHAEAGTVFSRFEIGRNRGNNQYFAGSIDDVRIFDQALSGTTIAQLASMGP
jgi:hypothetical protein